MRKTIWVGMAWLLALSVTVGCAGRRPFTPAAPSMAKNDWRTPKGAQPLGTQQAMGNGTSGITPPPQFPSGSSNQSGANAFGQLPPGMMPPGMTPPGGPGDASLQQTQYQQEPRRPIATNASNVNKSMTPTDPANAFSSMPSSSPQGQFEPPPLGAGTASYPSGQQPPDSLMKSYGAQ